MKKYQAEVEEKMRSFYNNLSEKDKRHYAAIEALKLGHGGNKYISNMLSCSRQTLNRGLKDFEKNLLANGKSRCMGGGRKALEKRIPELDKVFLKCT